MTTKCIKYPLKYTIWWLTRKMAIKIPASSIARPSKIYPNLDFLFENMPSGNPAAHHGVFQVKSLK
jgi:hypothetical protein